MASGYKVVKRVSSSNALMSAAVHYNVLGRHYYPGTWVEPAVGYLFVFERLEQARDFKDSMSVGLHPQGLEVWECEYEPAEHRYRQIPDPILVGYMYQYWQQALAGEEVEQKLLIITVPAGTAWAKRVRLLRQDG